MHHKNDFLRDKSNGNVARKRISSLDSKAKSQKKRAHSHEVIHLKKLLRGKVIEIQAFGLIKEKHLNFENSEFPPLKPMVITDLLILIEQR